MTATKWPWFQAAAWKDWWKPMPWRFWITPSGNVPKPYTVFDYIMQTPVSAHFLTSVVTIGASLFVEWVVGKLFGWHLHLSPGAVAGILVWICFLVGFAGQLQKADALLASGGYNIRNVIWRTVWVTLTSVVLALIVVAVRGGWS